jgi:hypothetical protein
MRGTVLYGAGDVRFEEVPEPKIAKPRFGTNGAIWRHFEQRNTQVNSDRLAQALLEQLCGSDLRDENEQSIAKKPRAPSLDLGNL